jgi:hypothetical protein
MKYRTLFFALGLFLTLNASAAGSAPMTGAKPQLAARTPAQATSINTFKGGEYLVINGSADSAPYPDFTFTAGPNDKQPILYVADDVVSVYANKSQFDQGNSVPLRSYFKINGSSNTAIGIVLDPLCLQISMVAKHLYIIGTVSSPIASTSDDYARVTLARLRCGTNISLPQ